MSDEGEKTCPLCAEEMDLTDQQLKPCKCGYEICVWCWHHIIDMAEKDETEGRCPACRTPYNKEKIVGMAANCERLVAEMNTEKRQKSQKAKGKTSEGRKQLGSVRVIQRNLVYIVGLPLSLADDDLLQRKEYFGQYGKVMKVSISRTAAGSIQHFANSTCSVYITYSKEEEAVRCIQMVHGFVLEGKALRACFGTTKYCHAWLRNVPCSNPDCLYLHEIGSQEDSFTKDEIISAYTRSRVQQIPGATNNMQRRSGNVLPPPADEYCNNSSASLGKPISRSATNNNPASISRSSPPNSSSGRSAALPPAASWGMRASNNQAPPSSLACSNGPSKQKLPNTCDGALALSTAVASPTQVTIVHDEGKKHVSNEENSASQSKGKFELLEHGKDYRNSDCRTVSGFSVASGQPSPSSVVQQHSPPASKYVDRSISKPPIANNVDEQSVNSGPEDDHNGATDRDIQDLCSDMSSISIKHNGLQNGDSEQSGENLTSPVVLKNTTSTTDTCFTSKQSDLRSDLQSQSAQVLVDDGEEELLSFDDQQLKDPKLNARTGCITNLSDSFNLPTPYGGYSSRKTEPYGSLGVNLDPHFVDNNINKDRLLHISGTAILSNGYHDNLVSSSPNMSHIHDFSRLLTHEDKMKHVGRFDGEVVSVDRDAGDMRESSIISNILSMDFDSWDDSLTSPQNLARLLGETNRQQGSLKVSSSWRAQNTGQSRFSFAREEESANRGSVIEPVSNFGQAVNSHPFNPDFVDNRDVHLDKFGNCNGFSSFTTDESNNYARSYSPFHSNKPAVSRSQITAPPGFSVPSRAPPPGFSSHERMEPTFDNLTGNHMIDNSTLLRNPYQLPPSVNIGTAADIEFMDPAILAVGKGRLAAGLTSPGLDVRANFSPQLSNFENDARLQLLMQRSLSPHQNQRFSEIGDSLSPLNDAYGIPSRIMEQTLANNLSSFSQLSLPHSRNSLMSNGRWDGWNEAQSGNDLAMSELLRTERLGFNKFYNGYEEPKFRMPSSGNIYNRTFGI